MRKLLLVLLVLLAPVLVVRMVRAAGEWHTIGRTDGGDSVSIGSVRVLKNNQRTALVRVEYKQPAELPQGGPFVELRARVRFDCSTGAAVPSSEWLYSRDANGRFVLSKRLTRDDQFGKAPEGGFSGMVSQRVCTPSK